MSSARAIELAITLPGDRELICGELLRRCYAIECDDYLPSCDGNRRALPPTKKQHAVRMRREAAWVLKAKGEKKQRRAMRRLVRKYPSAVTSVIIADALGGGVEVML